MNSVGIVAVKFPKNHHDSISQIAELLKKYPDQGVDLMCLGPLSNIASWSEDDELFRLIQSKINQIWIMGGNVPGFDDAEFNFAQDPTAVAHYNILKSSSLSLSKCSRHPFSLDHCRMWIATVLSHYC